MAAWLLALALALLSHAKPMHNAADVEASRACFKFSVEAPVRADVISLDFGVDKLKSNKLTMLPLDWTSDSSWWEKTKNINKFIVKGQKQLLPGSMYSICVLLAQLPTPCGSDNYSLKLGAVTVKFDKKHITCPKPAILPAAHQSGDGLHFLIPFYPEIFHAVTSITITLPSTVDTQRLVAFSNFKENEKSSITRTPAADKQNVRIAFTGIAPYSWDEMSTKPLGTPEIFVGGVSLSSEECKGTTAEFEVNGLHKQPVALLCPSKSTIRTTDDTMEKMLGTTYVDIEKVKFGAQAAPPVLDPVLATFLANTLDCTTVDGYVLINKKATSSLTPDSESRMVWNTAGTTYATGFTTPPALQIGGYNDDDQCLIMAWSADNAVINTALSTHTAEYSSAIGGFEFRVEVNIRKPHLMEVIVIIGGTNFPVVPALDAAVTPNGCGGNMYDLDHLTVRAAPSLGAGVSNKGNCEKIVTLDWNNVKSRLVTDDIVVVLKEKTPVPATNDDTLRGVAFLASTSPSNNVKIWPSALERPSLVAGLNAAVISLPEDVELVLHPITIVDPDLPTNKYGSHIMELTLEVVDDKGTLKVYPGSHCTITGEGTSDVFVKGTKNEIEWAISNIHYMPPANWTGLAVIAMRINDKGSSFLTKSDMTSPDLRITANVGEVNDAPRIFTHSPIWASDDLPVEIIVVVSDDDTGAYNTVRNFEVTIECTAPDCQITTLTPAPAPTINLVNKIRFRAPLPTINALLYPMTYKGRPEPDRTYTDLIIITVDDLGHPTPTLQNKMTTFYITVYNKPANDAPTITYALTTANEDSSNAVAIAIEDLDANLSPNGIITAYITVTYATFAFDMTSASIHTRSSTAQIDATTTKYTFTGPKTEIKSVLATAVFMPFHDWHGTSDITVTVSDSGASYRNRVDGTMGQTTTVQFQVVVTPVDDSPRLHGSELTFYVKREQTLEVNHLQIYDVDNVVTATENYEVTLTSTKGLLGVSATCAPAISISFDPLASANGAHTSILLRGHMPDINNCLQGLTFRYAECMNLDNTPSCPILNLEDKAVDYADTLVVTLKRAAGSVSTVNVKFTLAADNFRTCQEFLGYHSQYCGCYYRATTSYASPWITLPLDFPVKYYKKAKDEAKNFAQGCCVHVKLADRWLAMDSLDQVGVCTPAMVA